MSKKLSENKTAKFLEWILMRKIVLSYRMNLLMVIIWRLFGADWGERQKQRRLGKAILLAEKLHIENNGTRYFVLDSNREGYFEVMNKDQIKLNQKAGVFSSRATFVDFLKEARYFTKSENLSITKGKKIEQKSIPMPVYYLIVIMIVIIVVVVLTR